MSAIYSEMSPVTRKTFKPLVSDDNNVPINASMSPKSNGWVDRVLQILVMHSNNDLGTTVLD